MNNAKIRKGLKIIDNGIQRKIIDVEKYTDSDYVCYYVDIPFEDGDKFFEKGSPYYNNLLNKIQEKI